MKKILTGVLLLGVLTACGGAKENFHMKKR